jgi:hypothetical protein
MRTKTLLLTAALSAVSAAAAMAQTVYSVNAVGYVNKTITKGSWTLVANPLMNGDNLLATILTDAPANTEVQKWNGTTFISAKKLGTAWTGAAGSVAFKPSEGFFIKIPGTGTQTLTFVGEVAQNADSNLAYPVGYSLMGSVVPQSGKIQTDLQFPAKANDQIMTLKADGSGYNAVKKVGTAWLGTGGEPTIDVAQGFWLNTTASGTWTRNFSVNQ